MHLTVRLCGVEVFHVELAEDAEAETEACDYTTQPIGFIASPGDQRWRETTTPDLE